MLVRHRFRVALGMGVVLWTLAAALSARGQPGALHEDFTTTLRLDVDRTTARWCVEAGEISLFRTDLEITARTPGAGTITAFLAAGARLFVARGTVLTCLDVTNPESPRAITEFALAAPANALVFTAGRLVAATAEGLEIIDVRDPAQPFAWGRYPALQDARDLVLDGGTLYVAAGIDGIVALELRDLVSPVEVGRLPTADEVVALDLHGNLLMAAARSSGLLAVDVTDAHRPRLLSTLSLDHRAETLVRFGDQILTAGERQLTVVEANDPQTMTMTGGFAARGEVRGLSIEGDLAYLALGADGIEVVEFSNPTRPVSWGHHPTAARHLALHGTRAFAAGAEEIVTLRIADVNSTPPWRASYDTLDDSFDVLLDGHSVLVAEYSAGVEILDVTDADSPRQVAAVDTPGLAVALALAGDVVYVADHLGGGLRVVDVSDPPRTREMGGLDLQDHAMSVATAGNVVCVGLLHEGFAVVDVHDPADPTMLARIDTPGAVRDVALDGTLAFAADIGWGLLVIDLSEPTSPVIVGTYDSPGRPTGLAKAGNVVYLADGDPGVHAIDVSQPADPRWLATVNTPGYAVKLVPRGDVAFVADHVAGGLQILDITDPARPAVLGGFITDRYAWSVAYAGEFAYLANAKSLEVFEVMRRRPFVDESRDLVVSVPVTSSRAPLGSVRLTPDGQGKLEWEIQADADAPWQSYGTPDAWQILDTPGESLRWRVRLLSRNARCRSVHIDWRTEAPWIDDVRDAPGDEGGQVVLEWTPSAYDVETATHPVLVYAVDRDENGRWEEVLRRPAETLDRYTAIVPTEADRQPTSFRVRALTTSGRELVSPPHEGTSVHDLPTAFGLAPAAPNPFAATSTIAYEVPPRGGWVRLTVHDLRGRLVRCLVDASATAGRHRATWDGTDERGHDVATGVYLVRLRAGGVDLSRKLLRID